MSLLISVVLIRSGNWLEMSTILVEEFNHLPSCFSTNVTHTVYVNASANILVQCLCLRFCLSQKCDPGLILLNHKHESNKNPPFRVHIHIESSWIWKIIRTNSRHYWNSLKKCGVCCLTVWLKRKKVYPNAVHTKTILSPAVTNARSGGRWKDLDLNKSGINPLNLSL